MNLRLYRRNQSVTNFQHAIAAATMCKSRDGDDGRLQAVPCLRRSNNKIPKLKLSTTCFNSQDCDYDTMWSNNDGKESHKRRFLSPKRARSGSLNI